MKVSGSAKDPLWYKDAIIYETHVKAFFDSNNDGIGDFQGLMQKLDYLQDLGVTCLWLLPFFPSPLRDDGYDIADYRSVHPSYGTLEDFQAFLQAAHDRNMQVLIELVINHTSDQHPWFQRARKAPPGSVERDYYVWSDDDDKYSGARIIFIDSETSNWTWDHEAQAYYWHRFFHHQPDLNFDNPKVLEEVVDVLRYWLDMGVDGCRLDAIPYLVEREGTNCENLPETHAVIKEIRRRLDERYTHRLFLAEANQWPADVRDYFGDGDSCHMAFHFPVMPRIFMAVRMEDRNPIVEIMRQTPSIPEVCQWAIFLRNHDELTLEMVTDEERDYMYSSYAADPRMRINLGIRRRLSPLMDNSRPRIELLNSLLFSFPGTPVLYYGDEIGMGDNVYLGDRNGVRTPMQWSEDRNAGFSRANPQKIYSPPILDPIYSYEAINVEAQQATPSSLLHWMKNMIALRKLFKVFGRGSIEFLEPVNRKVLAYIRQDEENTILCVANLSRVAQPVELDLSRFQGMAPVEMVGETSFPTIGELPYFLTLGPYGFYWFELHPAAAPVEVPAPEAVEAGAAIAVTVGAEWGNLFESPAREVLESRVLPQYLPQRRWFAGKARSIKSVRVKDWAELVTGPPPAFLTFIEVEYEDGGSDTYSLPLGIGAGAGAEALQAAHPEWVLAPIEGPAGQGVLYDALADDEACRALLEAIAEQRQWPSRHGGAVRGLASSVFGEVRGPADADLTVARGAAEQSNSSILYGHRAILKLIRRLEPGPNPDYEIGRYLTEVVQFKRIPPLAGVLEYQPPEQEAITLAILQGLVENQGDGWQSTLDELDRYFEDRSANSRRKRPKADRRSLVTLSQEEVSEETREVIGFYLERAAVLGKRTAEMHLALARETDDPNFSPEPLGREDLNKLVEGMRGLADNALRILKQNLASLPDPLVDRAGLVLNKRSEIDKRFELLLQQQPPVVKTRVHGDYHLGQVLYVENDFVIFDFEGEPARPLAERRAKQSPLKDVAGMLRSFSYAAYSGLTRFVARRPVKFDQLRPWADFWEKWNSAAFLKAYRETAAGAAFLPADTQHLQLLLEAFVLDKALYELFYELNNRPDWVRIPIEGIIQLLRVKS